ncbi:MAG: peptide-methionine (R)-S-oxide reductase MsrB [Bacteroidetes bacterium]|nr:peptide-methionine (R)-S-oxide reductase MsrB [Bacteroidota bacterium]
MHKQLLIILSISVSLSSCAQQAANPSSNNTTSNTAMNNENNKTNTPPQTEADWKKILSPEQYHILREKGTEYPGTGKFYLHKEKGIYVCAGCGSELFTSDMKFESHCGWPSFDREIAGGKVKTKLDTTHGMIRTEIMCANCGGHLGHIFDDGPTETGQRYCVNSLSLDFKKQ